MKKVEAVSLGAVYTHTSRFIEKTNNKKIKKDSNKSLKNQVFVAVFFAFKSLNNLKFKLI